MPRCYLLAVTMGSSHDSFSNNWSLFTLVEECTARPFPLRISLEIHNYWEFAPDEVNVDFEFRQVLIPSEGDEVKSGVAAFKSPTMRYRLRSRGIEIPAPGDYELRIEWRERDSTDWTRCDVFWPLVIKELIEEESQP